MWEEKSVSVVLPAYNEEKNIAKVVKEFLEEETVDEVLVVDNNSTDRTAEEVKKTGGRLIQETRQGYGFALRRGLREAQGEFIVLCEPDDTFIPSDIRKLLAYSNDAELILGSRTSKDFIWRGANMDFAMRWGNWCVAKLLEFLFNGPSLTDVGCTMRLIKKESLLRIQDKFTVGASHFSPEMMILAIREGLRVVEIPLNYRKRVGVSKITGERKDAILLGIRMIGLIFQYRFFR